MTATQIAIIVIGVISFIGVIVGMVTFIVGLKMRKDKLLTIGRIIELPFALVVCVCHLIMVLVW